MQAMQVREQVLEDEVGKQLQVAMHVIRVNQNRGKVIACV